MTGPTTATVDYDDLARQINDNARAKGFWEADRDLGEMLALAISELSEALEEHRAGYPLVWHKHFGDCPLNEPGVHAETDSRCRCTAKPEGVAIELADCIIRCLDTAKSFAGDQSLTEIHEEQLDELVHEDEATRALLEPKNFGDRKVSVVFVLTGARHCPDEEKPTHLMLAVVLLERWIRELGADPAKCVADKMAFNTTRPYKHGKAY